jgi:hypothetical protein
MLDLLSQTEINVLEAQFVQVHWMQMAITLLEIPSSFTNSVVVSESGAGVATLIEEVAAYCN